MKWFRIKDTFVPTILGFEREPFNFSSERLWLCRRWTRPDKNIKRSNKYHSRDAHPIRCLILLQQRRSAGEAPGRFGHLAPEE
jgi:hypothetical protein